MTTLLSTDENKQKPKHCTYISKHTYNSGGARSVMVIVVGNGHEFKSWTRLCAFHIALIPLGKI